MYFVADCPNCRQSNRVEFSDNSIHNIRCKRCNELSCVLLRKQKFEVLFDLGTKALMDGYAREAVSSFSAALERFMEFYIRITVLENITKKDLDFELAVEALDNTWKHVVSQSERQVGMFAFAYLLREGQEPDFLTPKSLGTDFRNKVIHRGYLPRHDEVSAYAAQVFTLIDKLLAKLGSSVAHAENLQEREFALYTATLDSSVRVIYQELPGMFRARRFGGGVAAESKATLSAPTKPAKVLNDAKRFQLDSFNQALAERGDLLNKFKRS